MALDGSLYLAEAAAVEVLRDGRIRRSLAIARFNFLNSSIFSVGTLSSLISQGARVSQFVASTSVLL